MYAYGAVLDLEPQDVALQLLGEEKKRRDNKGLSKITRKKRYRDRRDRPEEGPDHGDNLCDTNPEPDQERVAAEGEVGDGPTYRAHYREEQLSPQVLDERALYGVKELYGLISKCRPHEAEPGGRDSLPVEQEVHGDEKHEQEVEQHPEGPEDKT